jgi:hypothetical protein
VRTKSAGKASASEPTAAPPLTGKPGLFAPKHEKEFYALQAYAKGDTEEARKLFESASAKDESQRVLADDLLAGIVSATTGRVDEAIPHLEKVVSSEVELPDELMTKYLSGGGIAVGVTENVKVAVEWSSLAAALTLVECYQVQGRTEEAIGILQQRPVPPALLPEPCSPSTG